MSQIRLILICFAVAALMGFGGAYLKINGSESGSILLLGSLILDLAAFVLLIIYARQRNRFNKKRR